MDWRRFLPNPALAAGQTIQLRIGWPEGGKGREMWRKCKVYDAGSYLACKGGGTDYSLKGVKRWKKGDETKPGRRWRPA